MKNKKLFLGIGIFVVLIISIILIKNFSTKSNGEDDVRGLTTVYVATGGGKEERSVRRSYECSAKSRDR